MADGDGDGTTTILTGRAGGVSELLDDLDRLVARLLGAIGPDALGADPTCGDPDGIRILTDVSARMRTAGHRLDVLRLTLLPLIEVAGLWATSGARTFPSWLASAEDVRGTTARREVRTARTLRDVLPGVRDAALAGRVGPNHLRSVVDTVTADQRPSCTDRNVVNESRREREPSGTDPRQGTIPVRERATTAPDARLLRPWHRRRAPPRAGPFRPPVVPGRRRRPAAAAW